MKRILASLLLLNIVLSVGAQKTIVNDANAQKREMGGFTGIEVSGGIDIFLSQGNEDAVAVSASDLKYRDRIKTEVKNDVLKIWYDSEGISWSKGNRKLKAYISIKNINQLHASGSSDVYISGTLTSPELSIRLAGSSDLKGAVDAQKLKAVISGASDMTISGKVGELNIDASGSSDFKDFDLVSQRCDVHLSGSSDVQVTVEKEINASASGSSDLLYRGNGVLGKVSTSGSSSVRKG